MGDWRSILERCGYPTRVLVVDFETYHDSECSLKKQSIHEYVSDPRFHVYGAAFLHHRLSRDTSPRTVEARTTEKWVRGNACARALSVFTNNRIGELANCTVVAHNARFELTVLDRVFGIRPPYVVDTLALCRHIDARARNDLDRASKRWCQTNRKGTMPNVKGVTAAAMHEDQWTALGEYALADGRAEFELFCRLLPLISRPEVELPLMRHTLDLYVNPTLVFNEEQALRIRRRMLRQLDRTLALAGVADPGDLRSDKKMRCHLSAALGEGESLHAYTKPRKGGGTVLATAKGDVTRAALASHSTPAVRRLIRAQADARSIGLHVKRVDRLVRLSRACGGRLPVPLKYHGGHTGRWSGDEDVNLQNLGRRSDGPSSGVQLSIEAPPGNVLVIVDAGAVEARGTAWVAGEKRALQVFEEKRDPYCEFASLLYRRPVSKADKADRQVGKVGVLGCGYGMGATKVITYAQGMKVKLTPVDALRLVTTYRQAHPSIVAFWSRLENAFRYIVRGGRPCTCGPLQLRGDADADVVVELPSGRCLRYHGVKVVGRDLVWSNPFSPRTSTRIWGGFLTENVVQALCRDLLADAILALESQGYHVAHHVHDEIVACVPEDQGEACLAATVAALSRTPEWAPGLPLAAEGKISRRYEK